MHGGEDSAVEAADSNHKHAMKARPAIIRQLVVEAKRKGKSFRVVAREFELPIGTVKRWCSTADGTPHCEGEIQQHGTRHVGSWMQSLHHDSAHFLVNGKAACHGAQNGVHNLPGVAWFAHDGNLRKCFRCMKHAGASP